MYRNFEPIGSISLLFGYNSQGIYIYFILTGKYLFGRIHFHIGNAQGDLVTDKVVGKKKVTAVRHIKLL